MADQLVITTAPDGRTTLEPDDAPAQPAPAQPFTQDHLFNAPRTMRGQLSLGGTA